MITIIDKKKAALNYEVLYDIIKNGRSNNSLVEPHKKIEVKGYEEHIDIVRFGEEYARLKKEAKEKQKEDLKTKYHNINTIVTQNQLNIANWYYINKTLIKRGKSKLWKTSANKYRIVEDYKKLFGHEEGRKFELNKILNKIDNIIRTVEAEAQNLPKGYLYTPRSKAMDYNGFMLC